MRVGILGGGQLAQMMAKAGAKLDMSFQFLCPETNACAAPYGQLLTANYQNSEAQKHLADWADVITYEFESIPVETVRNLEERAPLHPSSTAIQTAGDRLLEKTAFNDLAIPTAEFANVTDFAMLESAVARIGLPAILKTRKEGYDGKGQQVLRNQDQLKAAWEALGGVPCILEAMVNFDREVSIIAVRDQKGELVFYPLAENNHREGILRLSVTLDQDPIQPKAEALITRLLEKLDYVGVLTLELFQVGDTLMANEMAPRVHNTGHWSIEGAPASQFENHLRAVAGLP